MHLDGRGVGVDRQRALDYLGRAALAGHAGAHLKLGSMYLGTEALPGRSVDKALGHLLAAHKAGHPDAAHALGRYYADDAAGSDLAVARSYHEQGKGTLWGEYWLSRFHEYGEDGFSYSPSRAFAHLSAALAAPATARDGTAISFRTFDLAEYHYYGFGTARNPGTAARLLGELKARDPHWLDEANGLLGHIMYRGEAGPADPRGAVELWEKAVRLSLKGPGQAAVDSYAVAGLRTAYADNAGGPFDRAVRTSLDSGRVSPLRDEFGILTEELRLVGTCTVPVLTSPRAGRYRPIGAAIYLTAARCEEDKASPDLVAAYRYARMAAEFDRDGGSAASARLWQRMTPSQRQAWTSAEASIDKLHALLQALRPSP